MSAFIVPDNLIQNLVYYYQSNKIPAIQHWKMVQYNMQSMANSLAIENYKSVNHRYRQNGKAELVTVSYDDIHKGKDLNPVAVLKALDCLEYQSCEHDDYKQSTGYKDLTKIRELATTKLPGYNEIKWGTL